MTDAETIAIIVDVVSVVANVAIAVGVSWFITRRLDRDRKMGDTATNHLAGRLASLEVDVDHLVRVVEVEGGFSAATWLDWIRTYRRVINGITALSSATRAWGASGAALEAAEELRQGTLGFKQLVSGVDGVGAHVGRVELPSQVVNGAVRFRNQYAELEAKFIRALVFEGFRSPTRGALCGLCGRKPSSDPPS